MKLSLDRTFLSFLGWPKVPDSGYENYKFVYTFYELMKLNVSLKLYVSFIH